MKSTCLIINLIICTHLYWDINLLLYPQTIMTLCIIKVFNHIQGKKPVRYLQNKSKTYHFLINDQWNYSIFKDKNIFTDDFRAIFLPIKQNKLSFEKINPIKIRATLKDENIADSIANLNLLVYLVEKVYFVFQLSYNKQWYILYQRRLCQSVLYPKLYKPEIKHLCTSMWICDSSCHLHDRLLTFSTVLQDHWLVCNLWFAAYIWKQKINKTFQHNKLSILHFLQLKTVQDTKYGLKHMDYYKARKEV